MLHKRQGLPLSFEPGDDFFGIHAWLDDFQRNLSLHRLLLFSDIDNAHAAFANLLVDAIRPDGRWDVDLGTVVRLAGVYSDQLWPLVFPSSRERILGLQGAHRRVDASSVHHTLSEDMLDGPRRIRFEMQSNRFHRCDCLSARSRLRNSAFSSLIQDSRNSAKSIRIAPQHFSDFRFWDQRLELLHGFDASRRHQSRTCPLTPAACASQLSQFDSGDSYAHRRSRSDPTTSRL